MMFGIVQRLVMIWSEETCFISSATQLIQHPLYRALVAMGPEAVPHILRLLPAHPHLCSALWEIVGDASPQLPYDDRGKMDAIVQLWTQWGKEKNIL